MTFMKCSKYGRALTGLATLILMTVPSVALAQSGKLSKDLSQASTSGSVNVIVQYRVTPSESDFAKVLNRGGSLRGDMRTLKAGSFRVPAAAVASIANDPTVTYISLDRQVSGTGNPGHGGAYANSASGHWDNGGNNANNGPENANNNGVSPNPDFYEDAVLAQAAWQQYDGTGIGIAVIDSGINNDGDFGHQIVYSENFVQGEWSTSDAYGHGTHVAGILAGNGANSSGRGYYRTFVGLASHASLLNLRVLDGTGTGTDSQVIAAIQRAIQLKDQYNIRVINLSLGRGVFESYTQDPLCQAVESAWKAGIVVVVAAGNDGRNNNAGTNGYGTINAPGNDPYAITVGAMKPMGTPTRTDDLIASYGSKGPTLFDQVVKPDIVAPGNQTISVVGSTRETLYNLASVIPTFYYNYYGSFLPSRSYFRLSGTSMATPVVSGAAALVLQQNPGMTPDQVKARLMKTAYKNFPRYSTAIDPITGQVYTSQYDIFTVGAGYLDLQNAINNNDLAPAYVGSALSPTASIDATGKVYMVTGSSVIWGGSVLWGTSNVWGSQVLWGTTTSGASVLWGTSQMQGESVLWGSTATPDSSVLWGTSTEGAELIQIMGEQ
jgi:serine protease AprX